MSPDAHPRLSVIVPVYNQAEPLRRCLVALTQQTLDRDQFEVIVVDNGSSERLGSICDEFPGTVLLDEPAPGSYRARNAGVRQATGDYFAFTDADCVPCPTWLESGLAAFEADPGLGIAAGEIGLIFEGNQPRTWVELYESVYAFDPQRTARKGYAVTANLFTSRRTFQLVGLFNPDLLSNGDREWGLRVSARGFRAVYLPDALVLHPARQSLTALISRVRRITSGGFAVQQPSRVESAISLALLLRPPVRSLKDSRATGLNFTGRLKVFAVAAVLRLASLAEYARMAAGGTARRD